MKICVIIPVYNEAKFLGKLVSSVKEKGFDVIVINDGSEDDSGAIAKQKGAHVLENKVRSGKGASLRAGFNYILKKDYDGVITMDGDGQHDPQDLVQFITPPDKYRKNVIVGNRMRDPKGMPFVRYITNRFMSGLVSLICKQNVPDTQCGFRYLHRRVLENITLSMNGYEIESELLIKATRSGYKIYSVPIESIYNEEKSSINPIKDTFLFFIFIFKSIFLKD